MSIEILTEEENSNITNDNNENKSNELDTIENEIIEDDLKNFKIEEKIEHENEEQNKEDEEISKITKETAKIRDLLESFILILLFLITIRHKNIKNKEKIVFDFVNEKKDTINRICLSIERTVSRNSILYSKLQKFNDISFVIHLAILCLEFETTLNEYEKTCKTKTENKEKKEITKNNETIKNENLIIKNSYAEVW